MNTLPSVRRLLPLLAAAAATCLAHAEDVQIRAISTAGREPGARVFLHDGSSGSGSQVEVKSFLNHEYQEIDLDSGRFVITTDSARDSAEDPERTIAELEWPANCDSAILLFASTGEEGKLNARLIPDSAEAFPPGSFLIVSNCAEELRFDLEGESFHIEPMGLVVIADPPEGSRVNASQMEAFRKQGEEWSRVAVARWGHPGTRREMQVASMNPRSGRLEIRSIKDVARIR